MIERLIDWCVRNRVMVLLLSGFLIVGGVYSARHITVDAIPDLSDVQVVIRTEYAGQAPRIVEDQVTYPLTTAMLAVPKAKVVRGYSLFGTSFVYVIFEDGTDIYWARSRVLEQLNSVTNRLPAGVAPQIGPDATGVGWVFQYVLTTEPSADVDLAGLRSLQDWYLRYELTAVEGVSEVAAIGGFVKQYQVVVDPVKLRAYNIALGDVRTAIQRSNTDVGGRLIEQSETEYVVRGLGYLGGGEDGTVVGDLERIALGVNDAGAPIRLADVAEVRIGPDIRRGIADWNGEGEVVGGIVIMRFGENAKRTIDRVKERLKELEKGLPPGVKIEIAYDRSDLIERAVGTLRRTLTEEILVVSVVCLLFLLRARSALVAAFVLPLGVLATLTIMHLAGINANIMSLGGIAISIGVMVDSSIIMVENAHKFLEIERHRVAEGATARPRVEVIAEAAKEVGPSLFFALLIIVVSFLPIFVLGEQSGRLFKPLAFTKTFAMASGAILAVTVIPVLMTFLLTERALLTGASRRRSWVVAAGVIGLPGLALAFVSLWGALAWVILSAIALLPQRIPDEERNPVSRVLEALYNPAFAFVMRFKWLTLLLAVALLAATWFPFSRLGSEFMPPLEEGDLLYMPTTDPGIGVTKAKEILQQTDRLLAQFPEVAAVFGKIGRAETATDPAPLSMLETTITLHRDKSEWRAVRVPRFFDDWPDWAQWLPERLRPSIRPITTEELIYGYDIPDGDGGSLRVPGMNDAVQIPGLTNAWTMPIRTRIDMLSTGIRTPVGIKFMGSDLTVLAGLASEAANALKTDPLTSANTTSAFPEKSVGGNYFDIEIDRDKIARHGLVVGDVQDVIMTAVGGMNVTSTVEGLERYPVNVRYPSELRDSIEAVRQTLVATPAGAQVPLAQLAEITIRKGPPMVKSENARLTSWVYVDIADVDVGTYVERAKQVVARAVTLPPGTTVVWSGQYEYIQAANARLAIAIPLALVGIVLLLYLSTRSWLRVAIILLAVPFSLIGAIWFLYLMDYDLSLAVWVGLIALAGLDAETGAVMLLYLDTSYERFRAAGKLNTPADLWTAVHDGAVKRIRPKTMTVVSTFAGLLPLLWATGAGADTMRRLAVPMIGGLASSFLLELFVYPIVYYLARRRSVGGT